MTLLPHVRVVAELLHRILEDFCQARAVLGEVVGDVGDGAEVVVHRWEVDVGVPVDDPLSIVVVDEYWSCY